MPCKTHQSVSQRYCPRFGQVAIELGFITAEQLKVALAEQVDDELAEQRRRLLGTILFERNWMSAGQIETVLNRLLRLMREEDGAPEDASQARAAQPALDP